MKKVWSSRYIVLQRKREEREARQRSSSRQDKRIFEAEPLICQKKSWVHETHEGGETYDERGKNAFVVTGKIHRFLVLVARLRPFGGRANKAYWSQDGRVVRPINVGAEILKMKNDELGFCPSRAILSTAAAGLPTRPIRNERPLGGQSRKTLIEESRKARQGGR